MKVLFISSLMLALSGCLSKKQQLIHQINKYEQLQKELSVKISISEKLLSDYSESGDTLKANQNLIDLAAYIMMRDSLRAINDSMAKELKKY